MRYRRMRQGRFLQYEWKKNIVCRKHQYFIPIMIALQICIMTYNHMQESATLDQFLNNFLKGMPHIEAGSRTSFLIPGDWCLFYIFLLYIIGKSSKDFTEGVGLQVLLRVEDTLSLWCAKCMVCVANILVYYGCAYMSIFLFYIWNKKSVIAFFQNGLAWDVKQLLIHFFLPILASCVIGIWQMVLSMLSNSLFGVLSMSVLLIVSAYFENGILIGNYLMKLRVSEFLDSGNSYVKMIVYLLLLLAGGYCMGIKVIRQLDYIHVKGDL